MQFGTPDSNTLLILTAVMGALFAAFALLFFGFAYQNFRRHPIKAILAILTGVAVLGLGVFSAYLLNG